MGYAIRFDFPEGDTLYAGKHKGSLGWAPTLESALICETREEAGRWLANGYGAAFQYGKIVDAETGEEAS